MLVTSRDPNLKISLVRKLLDKVSLSGTGKPDLLTKKMVSSLVFSRYDEKLRKMINMRRWLRNCMMYWPGLPVSN